MMTGEFFYLLYVLTGVSVEKALKLLILQYTLEFNSMNIFSFKLCGVLFCHFFSFSELQLKPAAFILLSRGVSKREGKKMTLSHKAALDSNSDNNTKWVLSFISIYIRCIPNTEKKSLFHIFYVVYLKQDHRTWSKPPTLEMRGKCVNY